MGTARRGRSSHSLPLDRRSTDRTPQPVSWFTSFLRGGAVGTTEALPGISGGTVALIVRLYDDLIHGAGHVFGGIRLTVADGIRGRGTARAQTRFAKVNWPVMVPALIGMAVFLGIAIVLIEPIVTSHTQIVYAIFFGLVLGSLPVPYQESKSRWRMRDYGLAVVAAAAAFSVMGLPQAQLEPHLWVVFLGAAVAICALVIPGLSGSFILLTVGLYEPTLSAVKSLDFAYIGSFMAGAAVGLASFVKMLQHLLTNHRHVTLVVLTGLMAGSLRALWPWGPAATENGGADSALWVIVAMIAGFVAVTALLLWERRQVGARPLQD